MVFSLARLVVVASALLFARVSSVPTNATALNGLSQQARDVLARATPAAPHWVLYGDKFVSGTSGPPAVSEGFNVLCVSTLLSFLLVEGPWDKAFEWTTYTDAERATIKAQYAAAGIKLMLSAFGSTDVPTTSLVDPIATATTMGNWVKQYNLDGIDVDYEDLGAFNAQDGKAEQWLIDFTTQLRTVLPQGDFIITHAPVAPWFVPNGRWGGGGYLKVHNAVGNLIDWYNIQFYNQGTTEYTTCDGLLTASSSAWPQSSVFEMAANGIPLEKIVIGKPAGPADASNGFMDANTLAGCVASAKAKGWTGGAMVWEYPDAAAPWVQTVRASSWPV